MAFTKILGTGSYVPETRRTNSDLEKMVDTSDEWIMSHVGIKERRIALPHETHAYMAMHAIQRALEKAGIKPEHASIILAGNTHVPDLNLIPCEASKAALLPGMAAYDVITTNLEAVKTANQRLFGTFAMFNQSGQSHYEADKDAITEGIVYHHPRDGLSQVLARELGMKADQSFDVATGCASFNYGLALADSLIKAQPQYIVVVGVDKMLSVTYGKDRNSVILFGELASATVLGPSDKPGFLSHSLQTDGTLRDTICMKIPDNIPEEDKKPYFWQDGPAVYKWAVRKIREQTKCVISHAEESRIVLAPHQANPRMLREAFKSNLFNRVADAIVTGDYFGNSSTASIAHALDVALTTERIRPGDIVGIMGFGAGLSDGVNVYKHA